MKTDDLNRLRAIAPERDGTPALFTAAEREALFAATISGARDSRPRSGRRPVRTWACRLAPLAVIGTAAAVAIVTSGGMPGAANQGHLAVGPHRPAAPQTHPVAYVTRQVRAALASETSGTLRVRITNKQGDAWTEMEDLGSGATRMTTYNAADGAILQDESSTGGAHATSTFVDYTIRSWWTTNSGGGSVLAYVTDPQTLRRNLAAGVLVVAGNDTVNGQPAIHLHYPSSVFTENGRQYAVSNTDIWVSATTFLPVREIGIDGFWAGALSWSSQPPTRAEITVVPPAGFTHLDAPPPPPAGGGVG